MKIATRLNLLSVATILTMTAAVLVAAVWLLGNSERRAYEHLMQVELERASAGILQSLGRSGVVAATKEAEAQLKLLREDEGFDSASLFVVDETGRRVVYHPDRSLWDPADEAFVAEMLELRNGTLEYTYAGDPRLAVIQTFEPMGWLVGIAVSRSQVYAPVRELLWAIGWITFAALLVNALAVSLFGSWLMRRLRNVLGAVQSIDAGDLSVRIPEAAARDEIGLLIRSVNHMAENLEIRTQERAVDQAALRASEAKLRSLVDSSIIGVFFWDLSGAISDANDTFLAMVGYGRGDLSAGLLSWERLITPEEAMLNAIAIHQLVETGSLKPREQQFVRKDGTLVPALVGTVFLDESQAQGLSFVIDLTERKRFSSERQARRVAEAADQAKTVFLANMGHEFRTPMNAIMGMTQALRRKAQDPDQIDKLDKMAKAAEHVLGIVDEILDISKIEAGKLVLQPVEFDFWRLMSRVRSIVSERAEKKGLQLILDLPSELVRLRGDETRIAQALINYLNNAIEFTERGSVTLRVRVLSEAEDVLTLSFEVEDTGIGIPPETMPRLFVAFGQSEEHPLEQSGGAGLGLAITRRLAQLMGGDAGATSEPGVGSTFWFTARLEPVGQTSSQCEQPPPASYERGRSAESVLMEEYAGARVLLVEDDPVNQEVADIFLRDCGLDVTLAANGAEALELVSRERFDIVVMDVQMPLMDGLAATRAIRALRLRAGLPILAMTANVQAEDHAACLEAGMDAVIDKPVDREALYIAILSWLRRRGVDRKGPASRLSA